MASQTSSTSLRRRAKWLGKPRSCNFCNMLSTARLRLQWVRVDLISLRCLLLTIVRDSYRFSKTRHRIVTIYSILVMCYI